MVGPVIHITSGLTACCEVTSPKCDFQPHPSGIADARVAPGGAPQTVVTASPPAVREGEDGDRRIPRWTGHGADAALLGFSGQENTQPSMNQKQAENRGASEPRLVGMK
ncbi:hypothetical protein SKAU_G00076070 [Synaphobranchus kaupii]|uniref:Uncharacterized protein n=1 Tax=Synaphobranchus kaupii TaxID=118154 RepID=A0A9Q1JC77_SYNKA|nr:hypothetical protein SKAU_G00076070 [Synaphobranchus kaupii]